MHQHKKILVFDKLWKRLRYKQAKGLKYHSIPKSIVSSKKSSKYSKLIKLSNNSKTKITYNLRYISYSIPLLCIMLLLGLGVISFNPITPEETFAIEKAIDSAKSELEGKPTADQSGASDARKAENTEDATWKENANNIISNETNNGISSDTLITPQDNNLGSASITITATDNQYGADQNAATWVPSTGMAYRSHQVTVNVNEITGYSLQISYASGKDALRLEGDSRYLAGAAGKTPNNMPDNAWGFAWGATDADETTMPYYTVPQFGATSTDLSNGLLEHHDTYQDTLTKKLVFGAKFGDQNLPGHYKTQVMLSLIASAQEITTTLKDITYMHEITPEICASTTPGESKTLIDWRDGSNYAVGRLSDGENGQGNCWMLENLHITGNSIRSWVSKYPDDDNSTTLTSKYSDVAENSTYVLPDSKSWKSNTATTGNLVYYVYNYNPANDTNHDGAYYSWGAATAGSYGDTASICPKGWRLPTGNSSGEFQVLYSKGSYKIGDFTEYNSASGYWLGNNQAGASNAAFFPAAGSNDTIYSANRGGNYWSSTKNYDDSARYILNFGSSHVNPSYEVGINSVSQYMGCSVRCVAPAS